jgi:EAL domain-containing protein (putative c-di-GMP-specific phosphodiesterase class I)
VIGDGDELAAGRDSGGIGGEAEGGQGAFCLFFQPKVALGARSLVGFEALLRWCHPTRGILLPQDFAGLLADPWTAEQIDLWVLQAAVGQLAAWRRAGFRTSVSVNVSPHALRRVGLCGYLQGLFARSSEVSPLDLELEILETALIAPLAQVRAQIERCAAGGIRFALDDFGTGFSSLSHLKCLPVGSLKIDRSFVAGMVDDEQDRAIVAGVLGLGHAFHHTVVAEGVETAAHASLLAELGCDVIQGFCVAPPMPAGEVQGWAECFRFDDDWSVRRADVRV